MISGIAGHGSDMLQMWRDKIAAADTDQSGGLSLDEFTKLAAGRKTEGASANGGVAPDPASMFAKMDQDGDGQLSTAELEKRPPPPRSRPADSLGNAAMSLLLGTQEDSVKSLLSKVSDTLIAATDANGDGALSLDEFKAETKTDDTDAAASRFASADTNQDGLLSSTELSTQLQDALQQQLQASGQQAYAKLLGMFNDVLGAGSDSAKSSASVSVAA